VKDYFLGSFHISVLLVAISKKSAQLPSPDPVIPPSG
jgi:hypothetical protein